jgi:hypothetical protein
MFMARLRTLLATALLTLPVTTLSATQLTANAGTGPRLETSTSLTGCCMVLAGGRWWCIPC